MLVRSIYSSYNEYTSFSKSKHVQAEQEVEKHLNILQDILERDLYEVKTATIELSEEIEYNALSDDIINKRIQRDKFQYSAIEQMFNLPLSKNKKYSNVIQTLINKIDSLGGRNRVVSLAPIKSLISDREVLVFAAFYSYYDTKKVKRMDILLVNII